MKKVILALVVLMVLAGLLLGGGFLMYHSNAKAPFIQDEAHFEVTVSPEDSLFRLLDELSQEGVLNNATFSKLYYKWSGLNLEIKPGRYEIPADADLKGFLASLQGRSLDLVRVAIPEGLTLEEVAQRLEEAGLAKATEVIEAAQGLAVKAYVPEKGLRRHRLEGYLAPATYEFKKGMSPQEMLTEMHHKFDEAIRQTVEKNGVTWQDDQVDQWVVKAAMIERETNRGEEKPLIASVIENRLKIHMKLQLDATVLYARNRKTGVITMKDLEMDHPFNTYFVKGLPAGPICSPSQSSLAAVLKPKQTDFLYYVLNPATGYHFFTADYDEFMSKRSQFQSGGNSQGTSIPGKVMTPSSLPPELEGGQGR